MKKYFLIIALFSALVATGCDNQSPETEDVSNETVVIDTTDPSIADESENEPDTIIDEPETLSSDEEDESLPENEAPDEVVDDGMALFEHKGFTVMHPDDLTPQISDSANKVSFVSNSGQIAIEITIDDGDLVTSLKDSDPSLAKPVTFQDGEGLLVYDNDRDGNTVSIWYRVLSLNGLQTYSINFPFLTEENEFSETIVGSFKFNE